VINFDRSFKITVPISLVIIISGLVGALTLGFNNGVDFQAGLNSSIRFAPPSMYVEYTGAGTMLLKVTKAEIDLISMAPSGDTKSYTYGFDQYPTLQAMSDAMKKVEGLSIDLKADASIPSSRILGASQTDSTLSATAPTVLHYALTGTDGLQVSVESIRSSLKTFGSISIQRAGDEVGRQFMIRVEDNGKDPNFSKEIQPKLTTALGAAFGTDNVIVNKADFVGARFSKSLADQAVWLTLLTFALILAYCSVRFKPVYAIGAVLSVIHDALVLVAFIVFTRTEFNTSIIAAILTIVGYSINDTIVIYDRIREKVKLNSNAVFRENMNKGVTETLGRTFITSGTVLLSAIALYIFTTGSMKDFSLCIIVGVITGTYSSVFIASAFVDGWKILETRSLEKKQAEQAHQAAAAHAALAAANPPKSAKAIKAAKAAKK
jgi:preprotein translocase subunit SecF